VAFFISPRSRKQQIILKTPETSHFLPPAFLIPQNNAEIHDFIRSKKILNSQKRLLGGHKRAFFEENGKKWLKVVESGLKLPMFA
jgi:hypothetical protein